MRGRVSRMRAHIKPWEPAHPRGCKVILVTGSVDYWITMEAAAISPSSLGTGVGGTQFSYSLLWRDPIQFVSCLGGTYSFLLGCSQSVFGHFYSPRKSCCCCPILGPEVIYLTGEWS